MSAIVRPGTGTQHVGRRLVNVVHAVLLKPVTLKQPGPLGGVVRRTGQAVCGVVGDLDEPADDLFGKPQISCAYCAVTVRAEGIETWETAA